MPEEYKLLLYEHSLSSCCHVSFNVLFLFLKVAWFDLQWVIVVFSGHTNLLFEKFSLLERP